MTSIDVLRAVHHPTRRRIVDVLHLRGPSQVGTLARALGEQVGSVSFLPTSRGRYVLFRSADTLATRLDDGGVFTDTVVVRGLPEGRRIAFVR